MVLTILNKNKALAKVKITLKIKKKTYKATTNAKGKATFKIKKLTKKGKYKSTVTFAGNAYYNKVSKKVTITVKWILINLFIFSFFKLVFRLNKKQEKSMPKSEIQIFI